jgi:hypothetical protein
MVAESTRGAATCVPVRVSTPVKTTHKSLVAPKSAKKVASVQTVSPGKTINACPDVPASVKMRKLESNTKLARHLSAIV